MQEKKECHDTLLSVPYSSLWNIFLSSTLDEKKHCPFNSIVPIGGLSQEVAWNYK
ncbi:MAG: hypothetical protein HYV45_02020 [Candidatus Moranbacteria bacterium]|nr:hypothetical protein [Candidatus Moranbacteria bacterium]